MQRGAVRAREIERSVDRTELVVPAVHHRDRHIGRREAPPVAGNLERQREQEQARARVFERCQARYERAHAGAGEHDTAFGGRVCERASDARVDRARILARVDVEIVGPHALPAKRAGDLRERAHLGRVRTAFQAVGEDDRAFHARIAGSTFDPSTIGARDSRMRAAPARLACDTLRMPATIVIQDWPLPYEERLDTRPASAVDLVVVHCTELPDLKLAREFGEKIRYEKGTGNSGHYYVDRDGAVFRFVADTRVANQTFGYNTRSIGIELINRGRYPYWNDSRHQAFTEPYTQEQIDALRALLGTTAQRSAEPALDRRPRGSRSPAGTCQPTIRPRCCRAGRIRARCFRGTKCSTAAGSNACAAGRSLTSPACQRRARGYTPPPFPARAAMTDALVEELVALLRLERLEDNLFRGESRDIGTHRVFGGQVLGQALSAAQQTVDPERSAHSLHAYFLRAGDIEKPIVYNVERTRDGGSFSVRRVVAIQHGQPIFNCSVSFQITEPGVEHQMPMPAVPDARRSAGASADSARRSRDAFRPSCSAGSRCAVRSNSAASIRATSSIRASSRRISMSGSA